MLDRRSGVLVLLALSLLRPGAAAAQKLDNDDKKFLADVHPLMLADEESIYKKLKDKGDRLEFQKIFWARRDPDLATPQNEFQEQYRKDQAAADLQYRFAGVSGSASDCGRVFILLGKPDEVQQEATSMNAGVRVPETWVYKDKPGMTFQGGRAAIAFDADCRGTPGLDAQLDRIAMTKVAHPNIDYRFGKDGRLVKLVDLLPKDTQARTLFKQPRQDFAVAAQPAYLKVADGGTALVGLLRGEAAGLAQVDSGGHKSVNVSIAASAVAADGSEAGWAEQTMSAPIGPDGAFVGSFKLGLKPGKYTLKAGAVDLKSGKGSLTTMPIEVPDFSRVETAADGSSHPVVSAAPLLLVRDIEELPAGSNPDPAHPFAAFTLGIARLVPYFGTTFHKADSISIFFQVYDLRTDLNGKADGLAKISILKGTAPVASASNPITTSVGGSAIGPVPLAGYEPGKYVVQLKVADRIAKKDLVQETPIEIVP
ncbi:MAG: GWxTD domain-containing protein [Betaproteobacteria bacterium]